MGGFWDWFLHVLLFLPRLVSHLILSIAIGDTFVLLGIFTITIMVLINALGFTGNLSNLPMTSKISLVGLIILGVSGYHNHHGLLLYVIVPFILICLSIGLGHAGNMTLGQKFISMLMSPLLFVRYLLTF